MDEEVIDEEGMEEEMMDGVTAFAKVIECLESLVT